MVARSGQHSGWSHWGRDQGLSVPGNSMLWLRQSGHRPMISYQVPLLQQRGQFGALELCGTLLRKQQICSWILVLWESSLLRQRWGCWNPEIHEACW